MDKIIEDGFLKLEERIQEVKEDQNRCIEEIIKDGATLLSHMTSAVAPIVAEIGSQFLLKAKQDTKGELYDQRYYDKKMIVLGKSSSPVEFRPDNPTKKVTQQFCVLSETGELFEIMFSNDEFIIDTYASPLNTEDALAFYGYDIIYMLYSAMRDYNLAQEDILDALNITLGCIQKWAR